MRRGLLLVLAWIGFTVLLIAAGDVVAHSTAVRHFDRHVTSWVAARRTHGLDAAMKVLTWMGSWVAVAVTCIVVAVLVLTKRLPIVALILIAVAWLGEVVGVNIAKEVVNRHRPPEVLWLVSAHGWSFPSGHAANAVLVFITVGVIVLVTVHHRRYQVLGWLAAGLAVATVGFSRIELGVHWTTDVITSVVFVLAWLAAIALLFGSSLAPRSDVAQPLSDSDDDPAPPLEPTSGDRTSSSPLSVNSQRGEDPKGTTDPGPHDSGQIRWYQ